MPRQDRLYEEDEGAQYIPTAKEKLFLDKLNTQGFSKTKRETISSWEKRRIILVLKITNWNITDASKMLWLDRANLMRMMRKNGIKRN